MPVFLIFSLKYVMCNILHLNVYSSNSKLREIFMNYNDFLFVDIDKSI